MRGICASIALVLLAGFAALPPAAAAAEDRVITEGVIDAGLAEVWTAFTTKEGLESWMAAHAEIDLKVGGTMRTHYDAKGKLGDDRTIENTILCFDPKRMLSIKVSRAPAGFPFPSAVKDMWTVIYFDKIEAKKTKITVIGLGFSTDEESQKMRKFFAAGNDYTIKKLQKKFAPKELKPSER